MANNVLARKLQTVIDLSEDDLARIEGLCTEIAAVSAKRDIIREGERPEHVHLILEGWAARYKILPDGARQITAFLIPGDFCDLHVTILGRMDHGIVAITPCKVAYVCGDSLDRLTTECTDLTRALWWTTLLDEAVLREWVVNNGRRDAYAAVAHLLCEMHLRMRMVGLADEGQFSLPLTQEEIGDATAMTGVHINRTLQRLRDDGLIELRQRVLSVRNVPALRQAAGFDPSYFHLRRRIAAGR